MYNVMISYRRSDSETMQKLVAMLRSNFITPWVDTEGIQAGSKWRDELLKALRDCDDCIALISSAYLDSEHCRMELLIARSFKRTLVPIMLDDCFSKLDSHEETKGLGDRFILPLHTRQAFGLPLTPEDISKRILSALHQDHGPAPRRRPSIYISYGTPDAVFATELSEAINAQQPGAWIATQDIEVGENWREAQALAMFGARHHIVVLDEGITQRNSLRTELLLAEAKGLDTLPIIPPRLVHSPEKLSALFDAMNRSDITYRRLVDTQAVKYYSHEQSAGELFRIIGNMLQNRYASKTVDAMRSGERPNRKPGLWKRLFG